MTLFYCMYFIFDRDISALLADQSSRSKLVGWLVVLGLTAL